MMMKFQITIAFCFWLTRFKRILVFDTAIYNVSHMDRPYMDSIYRIGGGVCLHILYRAGNVSFLYPENELAQTRQRTMLWGAKNERERKKMN
ncbi:hypothetical protein DERF_012052 [Dermatophagoides farinae]|uniref:Secreted protein n=1 Tax=Dermatophagoides farinae TaxID=6954 RepID=A0A922HNV3_DERFA|nr:hypothetical protein DERF_012052 [Dermatophagoides farinae]